LIVAVAVVAAVVVVAVVVSWIDIALSIANTL
jgi:hypothetical protein